MEYPIATQASGPNLDEDCAVAYGSVECSCEQKIVSCQPADSYTVIAKCDALEANAKFLCKYNKTIGTRCTDETKGHMSVSADVYAEIQVNEILMSRIFKNCGDRTYCVVIG